MLNKDEEIIKKKPNKEQNKTKKEKKSLCLMSTSITKLEEIYLLNQNQRLIKCLTVYCKMNCT